MTMTWLDQAPLNEQVAHWIDEIADGVGGYAYCNTKLLERHRRYFSRRVPHLAASLASTAWAGVCPFCAGRFQVDGLSGWWHCLSCYRRGEVYALEYQLFGGTPSRWEGCRRDADGLLNGSGAPREVA